MLHLGQWSSDIFCLSIFFPDVRKGSLRNIPWEIFSLIFRLFEHGNVRNIARRQTRTTHFNCNHNHARNTTQQPLVAFCNCCWPPSKCRVTDTRSVVFVLHAAVCANVCSWAVTALSAEPPSAPPTPSLGHEAWPRFSATVLEGPRGVVLHAERPRLTRAGQARVGPNSRITLERPTTIGGAPPPPTQSKVTIVGKNEICHSENLVGPFLVHKLWVPEPPSTVLFEVKVKVPRTP